MYNSIYKLSKTQQTGAIMQTQSNSQKKIVTKDWMYNFIKTQPTDKVKYMIGKALFKINQRQTIEERQAHTTIKSNGIGFSKPMASRGTKTANYFKYNKTINDQSLHYWTQRTRTGYPRICQYARQLNEIAQTGS